MPFSYVCTNPSCKKVFEAVVKNDRCDACYLGQLKPQMTGEGPVDTFPARGASMANEVVRHDNLGASARYRYSVRDAVNRALTITLDNDGKAGSFEVPGSRVVQAVSGAIKNWVILSPSGQPDWGHFGTTDLQAAITRLDRTPPPSKPIYLRLGFQDDNQLHTGFGLVHILFSHDRQSLKLVGDDLMHLINGAEMRERFYGCPAHKDVHLDQDKAKAQNLKCTKYVSGKACGRSLTAKHQVRVFRGTVNNNRYVLSREDVADGNVLLAIFEDRDATYNLVTMYRTNRAGLLQKKNSGEFELLYPNAFS